MRTRDEIDAMKHEDEQQWALETLSDPRATQQARASAAAIVYEVVTRFARCVSACADDRDDIAQEAMLRLLKLDAYAKRQTTSAITVIRYMVRYAVLEWFRRKTRSREALERLVAELDDSLASNRPATGERELSHEVQHGLALVLEDAENIRTKTGRENARLCTSEWIEVLTNIDVDWPDIWNDAVRTAGARSPQEVRTARNNAQVRHYKFRGRLVEMIDAREARGELSGEAAYVLRQIVARHVERQHQE